MFKNMKLGAKLATGFGLLILIAISLGGLAVWNMWGVAEQSTMLAKEFAPEVKVANEIERQSLLTMYEMRGYSYTEDESFLKTGRDNLAKVKANLDEADKLAAVSPHLVKLNDQVKAAKGAVAEYESLAAQTVDKNKALDKNREDMYTAADKYMKNCVEFLKSQDEALDKEINSGAEPSKLIDRHLKITLVNDVIDLGNAVRVANFKSQATRDPESYKAALGNFEGMEKKLEALKAVTRQENNLKQIEATRAAAKDYQKAMTDFLGNWLDREELNRKRGEAADAVLAAAQTTSRSGVDNTMKIAGEAESSLNRASMIMLIGLAVALVVGIVLALFITRSITKPINRIIDGLNSGSDQVASASTEVSSSSQSLAEGASEQAAALEETTSSMEEMGSMTRANAENAGQADGLMTEAVTVIGEAAGSMDEM